MSQFRLLFALLLLAVLLLPARADTPLWRLDDRAAPGLDAARNPTLTKTFRLPTVPKYGVLLSFQVSDADRAIPECAVFSNGLLAGQIQIGGVSADSQGSATPFAAVYRLYIARELLQKGVNTLRFEAVRPRWCGPGIDLHLWWRWNNVHLDALARPAAEPLHGRFVHMGSNLSLGQFRLDKDTMRHAPVLKWLGIAFSGNVMRVPFWVDIPGEWKPDGLAYLQTLRDLNMQVCLDHLGSHFPLTPAGDLLPSTVADLTDFWKSYGSLAQFYELENEPGLFKGVKEREIAQAKWMRENRGKLGAGHVKIVAPGWTYWPKTWEADPKQRAEVEALSELTNGHSYGQSYAGGFAEQLKVFAPLADGWPKPWLNTETGANDHHTDWLEFASSQPHASIADRILRAHIAMTDHFMYHTIFFPDEELAILDFHFDWKTHPVEDTQLFPGVGGEEPRLKTFRRLACAYATHGAPLPFAVVNRAGVQNKRVLFRAVDTSRLPPLPGNGHTSDKTLLNWVNFDTTPQTLTVRVTLPRGGQWTGERFGPGATYKESQSRITLKAGPQISLTETVGPGDSVQYILTPPQRAARKTNAATVGPRISAPTTSGTS